MSHSFLDCICHTSVKRSSPLQGSLTATLLPVKGFRRPTQTSKFDVHNTRETFSFGDFRRFSSPPAFLGECCIILVFHFISQTLPEGRGSVGDGLRVTPAAQLGRLSRAPLFMMTSACTRDINRPGVFVKPQPEIRL